MQDMTFEYDDNGKVIKAIRGNNCANIIWNSNSVDIDYCNFIVTEVCINRGITGVEANE